MGTEAPTVITIPVHCAPKKAPCPDRGKPGRRKRILPPRKVRTVAYKAVAFLEITCGEYAARYDCCTTPDGVLPRAAYDKKVRDLVLERSLAGPSAPQVESSPGLTRLGCVGSDNWRGGRAPGSLRGTPSSSSTRSGPADHK
jgi:hypothetical protein